MILYLFHNFKFEAFRSGFRKGIEGNMFLLALGSYLHNGLLLSPALLTGLTAS